MLLEIRPYREGDVELATHFFIHLGGYGGTFFCKSDTDDGRRLHANGVDIFQSSNLYSTWSLFPEDLDLLSSPGLTFLLISPQVRRSDCSITLTTDLPLLSLNSTTYARHL